MKYSAFITATHNTSCSANTTDRHLAPDSAGIQGSRENNGRQSVGLKRAAKKELPVFALVKPGAVNGVFSARPIASVERETLARRAKCESLYCYIACARSLRPAPIFLMPRLGLITLKTARRCWSERAISRTAET